MCVKMTTKSTSPSFVIVVLPPIDGNGGTGDNVACAPEVEAGGSSSVTSSAIIASISASSTAQMLVNGLVLATCTASLLYTTSGTVISVSGTRSGVYVVMSLASITASIDDIAPVVL